jgi:CBS domain-containing protein
VTAFIAPWGETVVIDDASDRAIRHYMTAQPVTVTSATPIGEMAQMMIDAHIHRVLVVTDGDRACGVVSSTDILAAVAHEARRIASAGQTRPAVARRQRR